MWLREEWNNPSRTDYYLMQIAARVAHVLSRKATPIDINRFKIVFRKIRERPRITREQATAWAKAKWMGVVGLARRKPPKNG